MPLNCGPNLFASHLFRHGDADDAVSAFEIAKAFAIANVKSTVRDFVNQQSCPLQGCTSRQYDPGSLSINLSRLWGGPSPDYPGLYRIVARADYSFAIFCETPAPPPPKPDPIPVPIEVPLPDPQAYFERCLDIACAHFCTFKQAGSRMRYTHVHITVPLLGSPAGPDVVTGVGHDDDTNPHDPHHNTVSYGDGRCGFEVNPTHSTIYPTERGVGYVFEVYFIECGPDGCPEGWKRRECTCGAMCWTLSHEVWERWYQGHH